MNKPDRTYEFIYNPGSVSFYHHGNGKTSVVWTNMDERGATYTEVISTDLAHAMITCIESGTGPEFTLEMFESNPCPF